MRLATDDLICNKIAVRIIKVSNISLQNSLGTVKDEHDKETPKERYIYISRKKAENYWLSEINVIV